MKVFFVNKKRILRAGLCVAAVCLLIVGISVIHPGGDSGFWRDRYEAQDKLLIEPPAEDDSSAAQPNAAQPSEDASGVSGAIPEPYLNGDIESQNVSLSVNVDWGEEYIPDMLQVLADNSVKATFFLSGRWTENNPQLAQDIAEAGHEIGNHGYSHASPNDSSKEQIIEEIEKTAVAIDVATGVKTTLYAPPSGEREQHVLDAANQLGYQTILWSVDTIDWQKPTADTIIERVESKIHGGAIILSHPTESTVEALAVLLPNLQKDGYKFVTVSENIAL